MAGWLYAYMPTPVNGFAFVLVIFRNGFRGDLFESGDSDCFHFGGEFLVIGGKKDDPSGAHHIHDGIE